MLVQVGYVVNKCLSKQVAVASNNKSTFNRMLNLFSQNTHQTRLGGWIANLEPF